jgi:transcriptional regulator with XRE-family HTH domain
MGLTDKLDKLLAIKDLSRMGFAKAAGIPYTTVINLYEKGSENIKLSTLCKIADFFEVSLDFLVYDGRDSRHCPKIENMTVHEFANYLNANEERVQELLSAFSSDDLLEQLKRRLKE